LTTQKKLYQAVISYTHPQQIVMNVEEKSIEAAKSFLNTYLAERLETFEIIEIEEVSKISAEMETPADTAELIIFPGNDTKH